MKKACFFYVILGYICLRNLSKFRWRNNVLFKVSVDVDIHVKKLFLASMVASMWPSLIPPPAAAAAIGSKINVRNSSELYKIVRHEC